MLQGAVKKKRKKKKKVAVLHSFKFHNLIKSNWLFDSFMSFSHSQIGYLIPLNQNSEEKEKASTPKLTISDGTNIIGRNNVPVNDKRLSRKHLTITASADGTANLHVVLFQFYIFLTIYVSLICIRILPTFLIESVPCV